MKKRATIYDVAKDAGVSIATVSRYLKGLNVIAPATCSRLEKSIKKLAFKPSFLATSLARKSRHSVGLIVPSGERAYKDLFLSEIISGVTEAAGKAGWTVHLSMLGSVIDDKKLLQYHSELVDGSLILDAALDSPAVKDLIKEGHIAVAINRADNALPWIIVDNINGALKAARYLYSLGHKRIAGIGEKKGVGEMRLDGFAAGFKECKLEQSWILDSKMSKEKTYEIVKKLLKQKNAPTAFVLASDWISAGAYKAIYELGLKIPDKISVVGFDDTLLAEALVPSLTTVRQPLHKMGKLAFEIFTALLNKDINVSKQILLEPELVIRNSTAKYYL